MPLNPWLTRGLWLALGWVIGTWMQRGQHDDGDSEYETDEDEQQSQPLRRGRRLAGVRPAPPAEELKMVLVVNDELKMGKGKIGAQCAHAAVGAVERLHDMRQVLLLQQWEQCGQPKICLRAPSTQELRQLASDAHSCGLPTFVVQDAGRTQVAPGSRTVLAIGPAPRSKIDGVTGHLKLL